jgi:hypothetical protein
MGSRYLPACVSLLVYEEMWARSSSLCKQCRSLYTRKYGFAVLPCMCVAPCIRRNVSFVAYEEALVRSTSLHVCTHCFSLHTRKYGFAVLPWLGVAPCIRGIVGSHPFSVYEVPFLAYQEV